MASIGHSPSKSIEIEMKVQGAI